MHARCGCGLHTCGCAQHGYGTGVDMFSTNYNFIFSCSFSPQAISMACQNLLNPVSSQQQVLAAATVIAKHTSVLCNACKVASSRTNNPVAKRHFVQAAKEVANGTANLVKNIKVYTPGGGGDPYGGIM